MTNESESLFIGYLYSFFYEMSVKISCYYKKEMEFLRWLMLTDTTFPHLHKPEIKLGTWLQGKQAS
jgi:hypothetical protein